MKNITKSTLVLCLFFLNIFCLDAQPGNPPAPPDEENTVPISGIGYLLIAGAVFGVKKIYDQRK